MSAARGGALISAIHAHTLHGDPSVREFANNVLEEVSQATQHRSPTSHLTSLNLEQVSKPFFKSLQSWIFSGQLHDPFNEFFIQQDAEIAKRSNGRHTPHGDYGFGNGDAEFGGDDPYMIWEKRYIFVKDMLPIFVNEEFGRKVCLSSDLPFALDTKLTSIHF
jgi:gamma-tubulin complex component 3